MKKFKLLIVLLLTALMVPFTVYAEDEATETVEAKEVNVYFFRGEGCSHCAEAEAWFQSIEEEYGSKFKLVDYETWYNEENAALMQRVAEARGETAEGVPYIIVGNKSWNGFSETYTSALLSEIDSEYAKPESERYDIMKLLSQMSTKKTKKSNDFLSLMIILVIFGGIAYGIYRARSITK